MWSGKCFSCRKSKDRWQSVILNFKE
jgi:hypothetical protein